MSKNEQLLLDKNAVELLHREIVEAVGQPNNPTYDNRPQVEHHYKNVLQILSNAGVGVIPDE